MHFYNSIVRTSILYPLNWKEGLSKKQEPVFPVYLFVYE